MANPNKYRAFGLMIQSEFPIPQIQQAEFSEADVSIVRADLSGLTEDEKAPVGPLGIYAEVSDIAAFRITGGTTIQVDPFSEDKSSELAVYLMGSCMGAILVQRGFMLLHGSCVTDGRRSILITGDSGAGKSTTAAEFLKRGWKLVTDDVTCIFDQDGVPMVRSSYPSQKLWQDALDHYEKAEGDVHSLYFSEDREKFGINVADSFFDGICPLSMVVRLLPAEHATCLGPIEGMAKVDQLMRNTYRRYFITRQDQPRHFQRCVTLSTKIPMALVIREKGKQCADTIYELITKHLEEHNHD